MMINFFAMQIERGWITLEQVPKRYRAKVKELLDLSEIESGTEEGGK
ncbi:CD1375 family protein [Streptococcus sp. 10F2]